MKTCKYVMNSVTLNVLRSWIDIFGTNCNKLLKLQIGGGGGVASASVGVTMHGGQQGA